MIKGDKDNNTKSQKKLKASKNTGTKEKSWVEQMKEEEAKFKSDSVFIT